MTNLSQKEKAILLRSLHNAGEMLVLPNIWNPIGARVLAAEGYRAVATASAALSASLGYMDHERIQRSTLIDMLTRIARSVDVPVTADIEAGYGASIAELQETISQVIDSGVVGINLEDSLHEDGGLRGIAEQCARISAARQIADGRDLHLVINARVDCLLPGASKDRSEAIEEAVTRAEAYMHAGADCVYPIGPGDEATVRTLRARISTPINILASPTAAPMATLRKLGVNRVSFGPFVFRSWLKDFVNIARHLRDGGDFSRLGEVMSAADAQRYLDAGPEPSQTL